MFSNLPIKKLIAPVAILALACLFLSRLLAENWQTWFESLFEETAGTLVAIIIAALWVDRVQRDHAAEEWKSVKEIVYGRLRRLDNQILTSVRFFDQMVGWRTSVQIGADVPELDPREEASIRLHLQAANLDELIWLGDQLADVPNRLERILGTYGRFLPSQEYLALMHFLEVAERVAIALRPIKTDLLWEESGSEDAELIRELRENEIKMGIRHEETLRDQLEDIYGVTLARLTRDHHA